jgi:hypothetical protein
VGVRRPLDPGDLLTPRDQARAGEATGDGLVELRQVVPAVS